MEQNGSKMSTKDEVKSSGLNIVQIYCEKEEKTIQDAMELMNNQSPEPMCKSMSMQLTKELRASFMSIQIVILQVLYKSF